MRGSPGDTALARLCARSKSRRLCSVGIDARAKSGVLRMWFHDHTETQSPDRREKHSAKTARACSSSARASGLLWNRPNQGREEVF